MAGTPRDDPSEPDPFRRRKAIEELENRFRERPGTPRAPGAATGPEMDQRVADEMRQFFTESAERAARVVPTLDDAGAGTLRETTGEIRRKIDDFFSAVQGPPPAAPPPRAPAALQPRRFEGNTRPAPRTLVARDAGAKDAGGNVLGAKDVGGNDVGGNDVGGKDAVAEWSQAVRSPSVAQSPRAATAQPEAAPAAPPPEPERPKMDLKTALERLRRHGVVRGEVRQAESPPDSGGPRTLAGASPIAPRPQAAPPAAPEAPARVAASVLPPAPPAMFQPPALPDRSSAPSPGASAPSPAPAGELTMALESAFRPPRREPTVRGLPPMRRDETSGPVAAMSSVPLLPPRRDGPRTGPIGLRRDVTATSELMVPTLAPEPSGSLSEEIQRGAASLRAADHESQELEQLISSSLPIPATPPGSRRTGRGHVAPPPSAPPEPPEERALPPVRPEARARRVDVPKRVDGPKRVVRRGGVVPVDVNSLTSGEPDDDALRRGAGAHERLSRSKPAPGAQAASDFDAIFDELQGLVQQTLEDSVEETMKSARTSEPEMEEAVRIGTGEIQAAAAEAARQPERPARTRDRQELAPPAPPRERPRPAFATPVDEDEEECDEEPAAAPDAPYDWGVQKAATPRGAWLLGEEENGLAKVKRREGQPSEAPAERRSGPSSPSEPVAAAAPSAPASPPAGGAGGRSYLIRKLSDEVQKFRPAAASLQARGIVSKADLGDAPAASRTRDGGKDDDMLSVEQFAEHKPVDLEAELSPAKLVEELRRVRRLMEALKAKGLLSDADFQRSDDD